MVVAGACLAALALGALLVVVVAAVPEAWTNQDLGVYYAYGRALLAGASLYSPLAATSMPFTYPPFAAYVLAPLSLLTPGAAAVGLAVASLAALGASCWLVAGALGLRARRRAALALGTAGLWLWLEPAQFNLALGQVNLFVAVAVLWDLRLAPDGRWRGVGVGLAAGFKLTPALFAVHFLITKQYRAAARAGAAFAATAALGAALSPADSLTFWSGGFAGASIAGITPAAFVSNQSLRGAVVRTLGADDGLAVSALWLACSAVVAAGGLLVARRAHRQGLDLLGVCCVALVALLVSPISWSHHWVWAPVAAAALAGAAHRRGKLAGSWRGLSAAAGGALFLGVFAAWPGYRGAGLQPAGLIWAVPWDANPDGPRPEFSWTLAQALAGESYVLAALVMLALAWALTVHPGGASAGLAPRGGRVRGRRREGEAVAPGPVAALRLRSPEEKSRPRR